MRKLHFKILKKKQFVVFCQPCLDNDLLPKYSIYIYIYIYIWHGLLLDSRIGFREKQFLFLLEEGVGFPCSVLVY